MNVEACRTLLSNAWVGITSHNTYFTCDPDYFYNFEDDDEILEWTAKIISGAAKLGYTIADETMIPALVD